MPLMSPPMIVDDAKQPENQENQLLILGRDYVTVWWVYENYKSLKLTKR